MRADAKPNATAKGAKNAKEAEDKEDERMADKAN